MKENLKATAYSDILHNKPCADSLGKDLTAIFSCPHTFGHIEHHKHSKTFFKCESWRKEGFFFFCINVFMLSEWSLIG